MVKIAVCSASDLSEELARSSGIEVVPYYVSYGGNTYRDDFNLDRRGFYQWMHRASEIATTSHPNLKDYLNTFSKLTNDGSPCLYVCISKGWTPAYEVALSAKERLSDRKIEIYLTRCAIGKQALLAVEASRLAQLGAGIPEIRAKLSEYEERGHIFVVFNTLKYLARSGRIGPAQAFLGQALRVKPIIGEDKDGWTGVAGKVLSARQGLTWIVRHIRSDLDRLSGSRVDCVVEDAENRSWSDKVVDELHRELPCGEVYQFSMSPLIGAHTGPGTWGVSYLVK
jgi:DegV family protein with EDD domain